MADTVDSKSTAGDSVRVRIPFPVLTREVTLSHFIKPDKRVMDIAWMRDPKSGIVYTGEALSLALLLHAKGKGRTQEHEKELARLLDDPNQKVRPKKKKVDKPRKP